MELTVHEIAELVNGEVVGDGEVIIKGVAPFDDAGPDDITFAASASYRKRLDETRAAAVIVAFEILECEKILVRVENPTLALAKISLLFNPVDRPVVGLSQHAHLGKNFKYGIDASVL